MSKVIYPWFFVPASVPVTASHDYYHEYRDESGQLAWPYEFPKPARTARDVHRHGGFWETQPFEVRLLDGRTVEGVILLEDLRCLAAEGKRPGDTAWTRVYVEDEDFVWDAVADAALVA